MKLLCNLGGRKFILTLGCGIACSVLLWFAKLSDGGFVAIILGTVGVYIAGNVHQKVALSPKQPKAEPFPLDDIARNHDGLD